MQETEKHNTLYGLVVEDELRTGKRDPFWQMRIKTQEGLVKAMIWDGFDPERLDLLPHKGDLVKIEEYRDQRNDAYANIVVKKYSIIQKEDIPAEHLDVIYKVPKASPEAIELSINYLTNRDYFKEEASHQFVLECFNAFPRELIEVCPAATAIHHQYQGGLLIHTAEVVAIACSMAKVPILSGFCDHDVVRVGATLHDFGKLTTYGVDDLGLAMKTDDEIGIGHIFYSMALAKQVGEKCGVNADFLNEVLHVIAAHHTKPEFGAIKKPMTMEAQIVASADYLGSRAGILKNKVKELQENGIQLEGVFDLYGDKYLSTRTLRAQTEVYPKILDDNGEV